MIGNQYLWKTRERFPMEKTGSDALFDYFEATYCCEDTRLGYYFEISSGEECLVYAESGFHNPHTVNIDGERTEFLHFQFPYIHAQEVHQPPEWVRSAAFYQIFPERFWNGDPALSPEGAEPWGTPPTRSNFLGGDLKGVVQKLDHLTELGANAIYLTPIFEATSNHKYDTIDYTRIDPHFGTSPPWWSWCSRPTGGASALCWTAYSTTAASISGSSRMCCATGKPLPIRTGSTSIPSLSRWIPPILTGLA